MVQFLSKIIITLVILAVGYFLVHKTWTSEIDILRLFKKPADMIPVKEQGNEETASEQIQEEILEETKKHTRLLEQMRRIDETEHEKLIRDYPLGYAMIALSGDKNIVLPYTDKFETDWDNIKVYKDDKNIVWIDIPYLRDKRLNSQFETISLGLLATPGSKSIKLRFKGSFTAQATCLRANPVGIYLVLGFAEDSQSKP